MLEHPRPHLRNLIMKTISRSSTQGKFQPKFQEAWFAAEQRKQDERERRDTEIVEQNAAWAAEHGIDEDDLRFMFA